MHYSNRILAACLAALVLLGGARYATAEKAKQQDKPYLGIAVAQKQGEHPGVTLQGVLPEGPAGKAGLRKGDRIVMADGKEVKTFKDLAGVLSHHKAGDALTVKAVREGKEQTFTVALGAAPVHHAFTPPAVARPEDLDSLLQNAPPFFLNREKISWLEKKVQELEKRIDQLEKKAAK
jgi:predicted metalloprotease with PDZ domain